MVIRDKVAVVTGGASGIGEAIVHRFIASGAAGVIIADRDIQKANAVGRAAGDQAMAVRCDVSLEADIQSLVVAARARFGRIDIYVSNAGILGATGGVELPDQLWDAMWKIHVMGHVWAARAVLPEMLERGEGYFLVTASAAGLLNIVESAPYGVSKHAAVAFAEWLRIAYGRRGIRVSCLCPQSVLTPMTASGSGSAGIDGVLSAQEVADVVVETMREERFLSLPHPEVSAYAKSKVQDYDRWLGGMQKLYALHMAKADQLNTKLVLSVPPVSLLPAQPTLAQNHTTYRIDPGHSQLHFDMDHIEATSTLTSRFAGFSGELHWDRETRSIFLRARIDSHTASSAIPQLDALLIGPYMFDVALNPEIVLTVPSTSVPTDGVTVRGRLAMRGVERECTMTILSVREGQNSRGFLVVGVRVALTTLRSIFGMDMDKSRALSDEIRMIFNMEAKNEPPSLK